MMDEPYGTLSYSEELEPIATQEEIEIYEEQVRVEQQEEEMLRDRFSEAISLRNWCTCENCSLAQTTKQEECFCCQDIDGCREKLNEFEEEFVCITEHPGFYSVCLDKWVLDAAAIGLKTRKGRSYTVLRQKGLTLEEHFYRAIAYRQFYRFIWEYNGKPRRLPLPCRVYNAVRNQFPSEDGIYRGFEEEDEEEEDEEEEESATDEDLLFEEETQ